ncbi:ATP-binding protein [Hoeflea sp. TYP-13]|uniref:PAS domain-containing sensor histidine kinase n=1 Tax=Hoeflea sp. TYP-13 TaxID=3230023 RepID=UPI0034C5D15F
MLTPDDMGPKRTAGKTPRQALNLAGAGEDVWIEVIQKMDEVYADLVRSQTELEEKNASLEEAHAFIGSVVDSMSDVLIVCDVKGYVQQINPALKAVVDKPDTALIGRQIEELFTAESRANISALMQALNADGHVEQCDVQLNNPDHPNALVSVSCTARRDHRGRLVGMVLVGRPIGELQRAYRELDAAHKKLTQTQQQLLVSEKMAALGRLVAGVAHELNNPISFVFGNMYALKHYGEAITQYLEACSRTGLPDEMQALRDELQIDQVLNDIGPLVEGTLEGAERVRDIVQDLRRFSGNQAESPENFNLVKLIRTATDWVVKAVRTKPDVRFDMPEKMDITARKGLVHQIVVNLVQNAADVLDGHKDGIVEIACSATGESVFVSVADNGSGIAPDEIDKIFEPFFTTKPIGTGTGLGLYVSYAMAQKLGGDLSAANRPEGGAIFTLRIPIDE